MLSEHTDRQGHAMLICEMSDSHLVNTVNLLINRIENLSRQTSQVRSPYMAGLYGVKEMDDHESGEASRQIVMKLQPYLAELWLRSHSDVVANAAPSLRQRLQTVLQREGQLVINRPDEQALLAPIDKDQLWKMIDQYAGFDIEDDEF